MPRVRLRSVEVLVDGRTGWFSRFVRWMNGGEHWTRHHASVFVLTFFSFAFIHASRKTLSTVKSSLVTIWVHNSTKSSPLFPNEQAASEFLALLDGGFMFAYAVGLFFGGILGDRYDPRLVLSCGMWLSSLATFSFGYLTEIFGVYSKPIYLFLWVANGLFQSVAWPNEVCVMGNWFGHSSRGAVMGVWSACASVGNIIGTLVASKMVLLGYEYAFAANSLLLFLFTMLVFCNLISAPRNVGLPDPFEFPDELNRVIEVRDSSPDSHRPAAISFWRAWLLPGVISYSLAYACLKLVNYGFFFWLPFYLHSRFGWAESDADALSTWYDVGGIVSAILAGAASDHFSSRTPIVVAMLLLSTFSLFAFSHSPPSIVVNGILLSIAGFFVGGPANMISSSVSADLGKARDLHGSAEALSTVTGIVDGTGSMGAAFGQLLIPSVHAWFGWNAVFYGFMLMMLCTCFCLVPLLIREMVQRRGTVYRAAGSDDEDTEHDALLTEGRGVRRRAVPEEDSD